MTVIKCNCEHITCVCEVMRQHVAECQYRIAVTCTVPIECQHGFDVCPKCDPCTCDAPTGKQHDVAAAALRVPEGSAT